MERRKLEKRKGPTELYYGNLHRVICVSPVSDFSNKMSWILPVQLHPVWHPSLIQQPLWYFCKQTSFIHAHQQFSNLGLYQVLLQLFGITSSLGLFVVFILTPVSAHITPSSICCCQDDLLTHCDYGSPWDKNPRQIFYRDL